MIIIRSMVEYVLKKLYCSNIYNIKCNKITTIFSDTAISNVLDITILQ